MKNFEKLTRRPPALQRAESLLCAVALLVTAGAYQLMSVHARGHYAEQAQQATATKRVAGSV